MKVRRWQVRQWVVYGVVGLLPVVVLFWHHLPGFAHYLIPASAVLVLAFGWYDFKRPLEQDDPARAELEQELKTKSRREHLRE